MRFAVWPLLLFGGIILSIRVWMVVWGWVDKGYDRWLQYEIRPIVRSEINRVLCERGLSWDCMDVDSLNKVIRDRKKEKK